MADASKKFCAGSTALLDHLKSLLGPLPIPAQLQSVAQAFVDLQEERHQADYNLDAPFIRADVINSIERVELAFRDWNQVKHHEAARLYLLLLLAWPGMKRD